MKIFKLSICVFLLLLTSRLLPHLPNFTTLIALAFYIPALLGSKFIYIVLLSFAVTDLFLGFHNIILFTWGSVVLIGLFPKIFNKSIVYRILGCVIGALVFFIITNFGVWLNGDYGYSLDGFFNCYMLALPFFGNTLVSTIISSFIIEAIYLKYLKNYLQKKQF